MLPHFKLRVYPGKPTPSACDPAGHPPPSPRVKPLLEVSHREPETAPPPVTSWDAEIIDLEAFFQSATLPAEPVTLGPGIIEDLQKFIGSHLETVKANTGKRTFLPYLDRLHGLKQILIMN